MNCGVWEERVALYAGSDLPAAEVAAVEQHVADCSGCQILLSDLRQTLELLREGHAQPIEQAHYAAVRARVMSQLEVERRPWWRHAWVLGLAAAAIAMVLWFRPVPVEQLALIPPAAPPAPVVERIVLKVAVVRPRSVRTKPRAASESIKIKLLTDDPNVIIYWITDTKGDGQ